MIWLILFFASIVAVVALVLLLPRIVLYSLILFGTGVVLFVVFIAVAKLITDRLERRRSKDEKQEDDWGF